MSLPGGNDASTVKCCRYIKYTAREASVEGIDLIAALSESSVEGIYLFAAVSESSFAGIYLFAALSESLQVYICLLQ